MIERRVLTHEQESCTTSSRLTTIFTDEADARGTVFVAPVLSDAFVSIIERLTQQLDQWHAQGYPMENLPWQAEPPCIVEFTVPTGTFFPRGFLAETEIDSLGHVRLFLNSRRMYEAEPLDQQIDRWAKQCYRAIRHEYRVLGPMRERPLRIVRIY